MLNTMDRALLAEAARKRRLSLGRTMKDVGRRAGISHATVRSIERGDSVKDFNVWKRSTTASTGSPAQPSAY